MKYKFLLLSFFLICFYSFVKSQDVKNFLAVQEGNQIKITYDLSGREKFYNIKLFYSLDKGKTWLGPLLKISGDAGDKQSSGINKLIIWDALAEQGPLEGIVQFKIETEIASEKAAEVVHEVSPKKEISQKDTSKQIEKKPDIKKEAEETAKVSKPEPGKELVKGKMLAKDAGKPAFDNENLKKLRTAKIVFGGAAVTSAVIGIITLQKSTSLYGEYTSGSEDAANLRKKIESLDKITPIGLGIAGICGAGFVYEIIKTGKVRKQLSLNPFPVNGGGGINLTLNF